MTERELAKDAARRLAIICRTEEVTGTVAQDLPLLRDQPDLLPQVVAALRG